VLANSSWRVRYRILAHAGGLEVKHPELERHARRTVDLSKPIAVICATAPLFNPGMAAVDAAFMAFIRRSNISSEPSFFRLYTPVERNSESSIRWHANYEAQQSTGLTYKLYRNRRELLEQCSAIVFWGDFLHSREYAIQASDILLRIGAASTERKAMDLVFGHLYLSDCSPDTLHRTILFGGTLLFNTAADYSDQEYNRLLRRLCAGARGVWFRDVFSALRAADFRPNTAFPLGTDCALLLGPLDDGLLPKTNWSLSLEIADSTAGIFFARSKAPLAVLARFAHSLCAEMGCSAKWLPWFHHSVYPFSPESLLESFPSCQSNPDTLPPTAGDLIQALSRFSFVICDTYHLCLMAWHCGIPAVCIVDQCPNILYDVSAGWYGSWRDKRYTFYAMHDALDFLVYTTELDVPDRLAARLRCLRFALTAAPMIENISSAIRTRARTAETKLLRDLTSLVR